MNYSDVGTKAKIIGLLQIPPGTIVKMKCGVTDGEETRKKGNMDEYLVKILEIDDKPVSEEILLKFQNETKKVRCDNFKLDEYFYGKAPASI